MLSYYYRELQERGLCAGLRHFHEDWLETGSTTYMVSQVTPSITVLWRLYRNLLGQGILDLAATLHREMLDIFEPPRRCRRKNFSVTSAVYSNTWRDAPTFMSDP